MSRPGAAELSWPLAGLLGERPGASRDFSVEDDTLTPSFKLKRRNVVARYRDLIEALYVEAAAPPPAPGPRPEIAAGGP